MLVIGGIGGPGQQIRYQPDTSSLNTCREGMKGECSVDSCSLEYCFHNEVVGSVYPKGIIPESLSQYAVAL